MIQLFKDGDRMAIVTDAPTEDQFIRAFSDLLSRMIDDGQYEGDWEFQLGFWLPQVVDICCQYRGYSRDVEEMSQPAMIVASNHKYAPGQHAPIVAELTDLGDLLYPAADLYRALAKADSCKPHTD